MKPQLLIVEGKPTERSSFSVGLIKKGYKVESVPTGSEAVRYIKNNSPAMVVIDADSMRTSGVRICNAVKSNNSDIPIILIHSEGKKVSKNCADVVLELPFTLQKLLNRLRPFVNMHDNKLLELGPIKLDLEQHWVHCHKKQTRLTPRLFALMKTLMKKPGVLHSRDDLFKKLWETDYLGDTRSLDVHISWLRKAIEKDPRHPKYLRTERGLGYILDVDVKEKTSRG